MQLTTIPPRLQGYKNGLTRKIYRVMKLTAILLTFALLQVSARSTAQTVSLNLKNSNVKNVLLEIQKQTGLNVLIDEVLLEKVGLVTLNVRDKSVQQVLDVCFKNESVIYSIVDGRITVKPKSTLAIQSPVSATEFLAPTPITGRVTDDKGFPLAGVSIMVKGTTYGVKTDMDGKYTLSNVSEKSILQFSFVGKKTKEFVVGKNATINVTLIDETAQLDEVVVLGYGTSRKSDLTGSISKVKAPEVLQNATVSVEELLQGKVAGVNISSMSGAPGAGIVFNIRGISSFSTSQPLIVIDGYPIETNNTSVATTAGTGYYQGLTPTQNALALLNPGEIESIEILKDASSTAIYGSRGANGVVLITTKRGKEGKEKISYSYRTDYGDIPKYMKVLNSVDFMNFANEARKNSGIDSLYKYQALNDLKDGTIDWQKLIYQNSVSKDHQLNFSGGNISNKFSISANYTDVQGTIKQSQFTKGGVRINFDHKFSDRFKFGASFSTNVSNTEVSAQGQNNIVNFSNVVSGALRFQPLKNYLPLNSLGEIDEYNTVLANSPIVVIHDILYTTKNQQLTNNLFAEYSINNDLKFRVNGGINQTFNQTWGYQGGNTYIGATQSGMAYQGYSKYFNYLTEYTLNYSKQIKKHRINAVGGYTYQNWTNNNFGDAVNGFMNDNLTYYAMANGSSLLQPTSMYQQYALASYLGRVNYVYADKYLLTLTGRNDGASRLAEGNKWHFFPSAALAWRMEKEPFIKNIKAISELKLRVSVGESGNQNVGVGATQARMTAQRSNMVSTGNIVTGLYLASFNNPDLTWETTTQYNAGADISLFSKRVNLTVELWRKKSRDLLMSLPIPYDAGFGSYSTNKGVIQNEGLEFELSAPILTKKFKWDLSANLSFVRSNVLDLASVAGITGPALLAQGMASGVSYTQVGIPIGMYYGYKIEGIYQNAADVASHAVDPLYNKPGDFKFKDIGGLGADGKPNNIPDGKIDANDRTYIGNPYPKYTFGITNNFQYKNFELTIFFMGSVGNDIANLNMYHNMNLFQNANELQSVYDGRWTGEGTSNKYPRASTTGNPLGNRFADFYVEDGSYVRLKNLNLSYNAPVKFLSFMKASQVKFFVTGTNLITFTKYSGYDPEVNLLLNNLAGGCDYGNNPRPRTYSFGVNVTF